MYNIDTNIKNPVGIREIKKVIQTASNASTCT